MWSACPRLRASNSEGTMMAFIVSLQECIQHGVRMSHRYEAWSRKHFITHILYILYTYYTYPSSTFPESHGGHYSRYLLVILLKSHQTRATWTNDSGWMTYNKIGPYQTPKRDWCFPRKVPTPSPPLLPVIYFTKCTKFPIIYQGHNNDFGVRVPAIICRCQHTALARVGRVPAFRDKNLLNDRLIGKDHGRKTYTVPTPYYEKRAINRPYVEHVKRR